MTDRDNLWNTINRYVTACGGDPSRHVYGNTPRMDAVVEIERLFAVAHAAESVPVGRAPKCHQDPDVDSAWCAVHDERPDWHSEAPGYVGPAGWVCASGGMVFDQQTSDAALRAHNHALTKNADMAELFERRSLDILRRAQMDELLARREVDFSESDRVRLKSIADLLDKQTVRWDNEVALLRRLISERW